MGPGAQMRKKVAFNQVLFIVCMAKNAVCYRFHKSLDLDASKHNNQMQHPSPNARVTDSRTMPSTGPT
ncbi:uncharacterized protein PHALS_09740 [Plasmopara halstedii]|uniref:Uncharacterized protein n=1 Tax=Plasmopara halstedii TaxID=4781 RepID=A0A0P1AEN5_PLAHL|nr:uncharacterized protein PHALS_09740 [Plasmopara halstedii]CEG39496.1 hypothetical protein PHALS_09740 [Plasmopara halstedii]|eukprot:XP_024575865.1 hypothetical protein PHALS_09740 [Plasmopara halstedii]